ncbi:MAG: GGDEF domain-containing protein [Deltaproteobacteria bacterium]|nr:GGDEF domain-containing protein [Deltaproteobacteria bacterium]
MSAEIKITKKHYKKDAVLCRVDQVLADPAAAGVDVAAEYKSLAESYRKLHHVLYKTLAISDLYQQESKELTCKLEETLQSFQKLKEVALPICMICHKIRISYDYWEKLEEYFAKYADIAFSHGICPECTKVTYGKLGEQVLARLNDDNNQRSPEKTKEPEEDDSLKEMRAVLEFAAASNNPLAPDLEKIVKNYAKLLRRFIKIVSLGDSYQSQLREFNLRLELMAHTDPLTGINNRGYFMDLLGVELERAGRYGRLFSILMLDLDHFKSVNDTYGHAAGDQVLRSLAAVFQAAGLRKSDFIGRIGGEEFALVLPETDIRIAAEVAERLRVTLEKTAVQHNNEVIYVTVSIGISRFRVGDTQETLLQRADEAMYMAKEKGRNVVCLEP